jgi:hypothetical protein
MKGLLFSVLRQTAVVRSPESDTLVYGFRFSDNDLVEAARDGAGIGTGRIAPNGNACCGIGEISIERGTFTIQLEAGAGIGTGQVRIGRAFVDKIDVSCCTLVISTRTTGAGIGTGEVLTPS